MSDDRFELKAELLDDFFAECDEQLATMREQLATLDAAVGSGQVNPPALEILYRTLHSFKGNAAIVGLAAAEQLAHAAEDVLRRLTRGETRLEASVLDVLGQVGQRLDQLVSAFRLRQPEPEATDLLARLGAAPVTPGRKTTALPETKLPGIAIPSRREEAPAVAGSQAWRATFSPTAELDQRGINVNSVRARLAAVGRIVAAVPIIKPGGRMSFEFTVALREVPTDLSTWEQDGVIFQPDVPATAVPKSDSDASGGVAPTASFTAPSHIVRVDLGRLDELMRIAGEMVIHRSRLQDRIAQLKDDRAPLQEVNLAFTRSLRDLREAIMRVRLVPVLEIFSRLPFVVRDLSRETGKQVRLVLEGQDTEVDKYIVERLKEPLLHLVRNAVSHGVETPEERVAAGKPPEATLLLRARAVGDAVDIQIRDDGRGIDAAKVATRAEAAGSPIPVAVDEAGLLQLLCTPGFSTRDEADRAAGRGVGMAVVDSTIRDLGGSLSLATQVGVFSQFTLRLPLTLSIAETLVVSAGAQLCAVPQSSITEVVQLPTPELRTINQAEVVPYRGGLIPILRLRDLFRLERGDHGHLTLLILATERGAVGLAIDGIRGQREVVVRPIQDPLIRVPGVSGATELGDGRPVLILDVATLALAMARVRSSLAQPAFSRSA